MLAYKKQSVIVTCIINGRSTSSIYVEYTCKRCAQNTCKIRSKQCFQHPFQVHSSYSNTMTTLGVWWLKKKMIKSKTAQFTLLSSKMLLCIIIFFSLVLSTQHFYFLPCLRQNILIYQVPSLLVQVFFKIMNTVITHSQKCIYSQIFKKQQ